MSITRNLLPFFIFRTILLLASFLSPSTRQLPPSSSNVNLCTQNSHTRCSYGPPTADWSLDLDTLLPPLESLPNPRRSLLISIKTRISLPPQATQTALPSSSKHIERFNASTSSTTATTPIQEAEYTKESDGKEALSTAAIVQVGIGTAAIITALVF